MKKKLALALSVFVSLNAQDLKTSVEEVLSTNPVVLERLKNYNATKEDITNAEAGYYPKIDISLGAGNENTEKRNVPLTAEDKSYNFDVYQNSITYTQNIFKGFETTSQIEQQELRVVAAAYNYIEKVNDMSFEMVNAYIQVMKNQELLETSKENVKIDEDIFEKVQKLYDSGLTTLSEVNKIESSLALAKANLVVQENTLLDARYNLEKILGRNLEPSQMLQPVLNVNLPSSKEEATQFAMQNNPSLLVGTYNIKLAQAVHKEKKSSFYPSLDVEISQSMSKNMSAAEGEDDRFRAMAYVNYNLFNGFADTSALQKSISQVHQEVESKNTLRRQVIESLNLAWSANEKLGEQLKHLEHYKEFSLKTLTLYSKEYDLGRRSLLDLLSAQNDFIGSKSQVITTKYSLLFAKFRILDSMGILVPTLMGSHAFSYANVGLDGHEPQNLDTLPIEYDRDKDLIVDEKDLCANSLSSELKNIYGCAEYSSQTQRIERYSGFLFSDETLKSDSEELLEKLITQLNPYGLKNIKFEILANAQDEDLSKEALYELSTKRAQTVKEKLLNAGALEGNITIISNADTAPMYSDDSDKNNRVDIIVHKLNK
ncbi:MAG: TolC family outer membrane protein [Sulfurimonas sp.]|nr:TolC family outer membrane protein [Sulfurimonas sp.]MBU3939385.1 TolC family outer membrane protein [bacterium]MBU4023713.1 TolC family outer membrane protein [bacterium]MBU4058412.1 TolC family outer membrane protein [bacterium]MBU4110113.1 TolC family outer membrane protein [bacterium]